MIGKNIYDYWTKLDHTTVKKWFNDINTNHKDRLQALELIKEFSPSTLLEIGTGGGKDYIMFKENLPQCRYSGVDVSDSIISELKSRYPEISMTCTNIYNGLPFEDKQFDVVYARHVLEHCPYYDKPLKEMCRVASKAVVIVSYKPFEKKDDISFYNNKNDNRYGREKIYQFLNTLGSFVSIPQMDKKARETIVIKL